MNRTYEGNRQAYEIVSGFLVKRCIVNNWRSIIPELNDLKPYFNSSINQLKITFSPHIAALLGYKILEESFRNELEKAGMDWLYWPILRSYINTSTDYEQRRIIGTLLPVLYKTEIKQFSEIIFSDLPKLDGKGATIPPRASPREVICNQDGYDEGVEISCTKGAPLKLDDTTPIGYNIHLPDGPVKAIYTKAYGGYGPYERIAKMFRPNDLNELERYLLSQGVAVVTLNLVDLRDLHVYQAEMPENLHKRLHASINKYFEVMNGSPETLHESLASLKGKPNFLYGASFGGRTAIKHAELYANPKTFSGYLSHDGLISMKAAQQLDLDRFKNKNAEAVRLRARDWLDPANGIGGIESPIMLLHNFDDNNVNIGISLDFYNKAIAAGKKDLVRVLFSPKGNPIPGSVENFFNKGHYLPDSEALSRMGDYILQFMLKGPSAIPSASELTAHSFQRIVICGMHRLLNVFSRKLIETIARPNLPKYLMNFGQINTCQFFSLFIGWID